MALCSKTWHNGKNTKKAGRVVIKVSQMCQNEKWPREACSRGKTLLVIDHRVRISQNSQLWRLIVPWTCVRFELAIHFESNKHKRNIVLSMIIMQRIANIFLFFCITFHRRIEN